MSDYIILGVITVLPALLAFTFRVNAVYFFLSAAAGLLLSQFISAATSLALSSVLPHNNFENYIKLALLLAPVIFTLIFLRKTVSGAKLFLHFIPLLLTSVALGTFVISYLPSSMQDQLIANKIGHMIYSAQDLLIAAAAIVNLIVAWMTMRHPKTHSKKHK